MILLDSNAVIAFMNCRPPSVRATFETRRRDGIAICLSSIVVFELRYGVAKSQRRVANAAVLDGFLAGQVSVLGFDAVDARSAGEIRAGLEAKGKPIGPYDVLIAGQALRHGATLVTANTREFARVAGLKWEDWGSE